MFPMMLVMPASLFLAFLVMTFLVGYALSFPPLPKMTPAPIQTLETGRRTDGLDPQICETCYQAGKRASAEEVEKLAGKLERREELVDRLRGSIAEFEASTAAMSARFGELGDEHAKEVAGLKREMAGLTEVHEVNKILVRSIDKRSSEINDLRMMLAGREKTIEVLQGSLAAKQDGIKEHAARLQSWADDQVKAARNEAFHEGYQAGYGKAMARVLGAVENLPGPDLLG